MVTPMRWILGSTPLISKFIDLQRVFYIISNTPQFGPNGVWLMVSQRCPQKIRTPPQQLRINLSTSPAERGWSWKSGRGRLVGPLTKRYEFRVFLHERLTRWPKFLQNCGFGKTHSSSPSRWIDITQFSRVTNWNHNTHHLRLFSPRFHLSKVKFLFPPVNRATLSRIFYPIHITSLIYHYVLIPSIR